MEGKGTVDPGVRAFVEKRVKERAVALAQLIPGKSMLNINFREGGNKLLCVYRSHDKTSITVEASKEILDWLFRGKYLVLSGDFQTTEEMTFNFLDIKDIKIER